MTFLQGKLNYAVLDFWRFVLNTTIGVGGLFDVASAIGLPTHYQDFGLTLAYWSGGKPSSYLMMPLLGPGTFRDYFAAPADYATTPWSYMKPRWIGYSIFAVEVLDVRSRLLPADKLIDQSFDPYIFVRDAYLQRRNKLIEDNKKKRVSNPGNTVSVPPAPVEGYSSSASTQKY